MKRGLVLFLSLLLAFSLVGCGAQEKAGEKALEKMIGSSSDAEVDIDGDKIKIKTEDGTEEFTLGTSQWPQTEFAKNIPEFKEGEIVSVMTSDGYIMIGVEKVKEKAFATYLEAIKELYNQSVLEMNAEGVTTYGATNGEANEISVILTYDSPRETATIIVTQAEEDEE